MTVRILIGHVLHRLRDLPSESVHCIWTSIPYWGLRSYQTEPQVWGALAGCTHEWGAQQRNGKRQDIKPSSETTSVGRVGVDERQGTAVLDGGRFCQHCGAWRGEHGLEPSLDMWLQHEVDIWRELRRVLRKDGTAWLNCGDAYATSTNGRSAADTKAVGNDDRTFRDKPISTAAPKKRVTAGQQRTDVDVGGWGASDDSIRWRGVQGLASKQRLMLPARVALALQADGWWLRDEIVWHKPNPMPSSVKDRTTPAHEMLYLLTRSARYYFDAAAIHEPMSDVSIQRLSQPSINEQKGGAKQDMYEANGLNAKSGSRRPNEIVKGLAKKAFDPSEAHKRLNNQSEKLVAGEKWGARHEGWKATAADRAGRNKRSVWTIPTEPFPGAHFATAPTELVKPCILAGCPKGGTVLDPFGGSGTTGMVADRLGRDAILIELNPDYAAIAHDRVYGDAPMFADVQTTEAA